MIVEQFGDVILNTLKNSPETFEWFTKEWIHLVSVDPETRAISIFKNGIFEPYTTVTKTLESVKDVSALLESSQENFPVYLIK